MMFRDSAILESKHIARISVRRTNGVMRGNEMAVAAKVFDIPEQVALWLFGGEASKHEEGAKAEVEMAEIIEKAAKGDIPQDVIADIISDC